MGKRGSRGKKASPAALACTPFLNGATGWRQGGIEVGLRSPTAAQPNEQRLGGGGGGLQDSLVVLFSLFDSSYKQDFRLFSATKGLEIISPVY